MLTATQGRLVTKDELVKTVWQGLSISNAAISARINAVRKAVGDTGRDQANIMTVHGLGFQLIAEVNTAPRKALQTVSGDAVSTQIIRFTPSSNNAKNRIRKWWKRATTCSGWALAFAFGT